MAIDLTNIAYTENSSGRHTEVAYKDADGVPVMSRFVGFIDTVSAITMIERFRALDRNRRGR